MFLESIDELKQNIKEYTIAIDLNQHKKLTELTSKICLNLVGILDLDIEELEGKYAESSDEQTNEIVRTNLTRYINLICDELRKKSNLAATYKDVVEFVNQQDMLCLSKILGAVKEGGSQRFENELDIVIAEIILKKSIALLMNFSNESHMKLKHDTFQIDKNSIDRLFNISFPVYKVRFKHNESNPDRSYDLESLITDSDSKQNGICKISDLLASDWFCNEFLENYLNRPFPLDRFTILISIWIIAYRCKHIACQQLISELVDQIYHEEMNTHNKEQLMQLTQSGSFWLSYHKKFNKLISYAQETEEMFDEDDDLSVFSQGNSLENEDNTYEANPIKRKERFESKLSQLRKIIDRELFYGKECLICGFQTNNSILLNSQNSSTCSNCSNYQSQVTMRTDITFDDINLINLNLIMKMTGVNTFHLITPNEWVRPLFKMTFQHANDRFKQRQIRSPTLSKDYDSDLQEPAATGTIDRFTVKRRELSEQEDEKSSRSSDEDSDDGLNIRGNNLYSDSLERFAKWRKSNSIRDTDKRNEKLPVSESLSFMRFCRVMKNEIICICSSDILVLDEDQTCFELGLIALTNWNSHGSLWMCNARSSTSGLIYGCKRIFGSTELVRLNGSAGYLENSFVCPYCKHQLSKLRTLHERLHGD